MPTYGSIYPSFWTGETGRALKKAGPEAQLVALYLLSNGHSNPLGIYYLPKILISHETALSEQGASKGLQRGIQIGFCAYDEASEVIFVPKMAYYQVGPELKQGDKRVKWINDTYRLLPNNPFLYAFYKEYGAKYHIEKPRGSEGAWKGLQCPIEANTTHTLTHTLSQTLAQEKEGPTSQPPEKPQPIDYPPWLDQRLWTEFKQYRKKLSKKFSQRAELLCLNDLTKLIEEFGVGSQAEIINATLKSEKWLSFYPPRRNGNGKPHKLDSTMEIFKAREYERQAEDSKGKGVRSNPIETLPVLPNRDNR